MGLCNSMTQDTKSLEEKKVGVKGLGRKKTDESEHFVWQDDIKVPCGRLVPSDDKESILEYNEYAIYDPTQVSVLDRVCSPAFELGHGFSSFSFVSGKHQVFGSCEV